MTSRVALIGVGNPWRRDDGVAGVIVAAAGHRLPPAVALVEADGEPSRLIDAWADADLAVVVDAVSSGATPGTIHVWRGVGEIARSAASTGTHALGLAEAIALGRALHRLPRTLVIVGVEVADISPGQGLSPKVAAAVDDAVAMIVEVIQAGSKATSSTGE